MSTSFFVHDILVLVVVYTLKQYCAVKDTMPTLSYFHAATPTPSFCGVYHCHLYILLHFVEDLYTLCVRFALYNDATKEKDAHEYFLLTLMSIILSLLADACNYQRVIRLTV